MGWAPRLRSATNGDLSARRLDSARRPLGARRLGPSTPLRDLSGRRPVSVRNWGIGCGVGWRGVCGICPGKFVFDGDRSGEGGAVGRGD